jgi:hypothetical protein
MAELRLHALDLEDLAILSAHCQDAIVKIGDIAFLRRERRFVLVANRFDHETKASRWRPSRPQRRNAGLRFDAVGRVQIAGFDPMAQDGVLVLLAMQFQPTTAPAGQITLQFAAGASVRLDVDYIEVELKDLGGVWATTQSPNHENDDDARGRKTSGTKPAVK